MNDDIHQGVGQAWLALAGELREELRKHDPDARVEATVDPSGLLRLDVRTTPGQRVAARALARRYEEKARCTCEACGGAVSLAGAGAVVTMLCAHCTTEA
jgi:hypothetical protein